jgi:hypothetical protein
MSYDIFFVRRDPGQSFEDALDETEAAFEGDPGPLSDAELEQWDEVLPAARAILGEVQEFGDETTRELTHLRTGIELSLFNGEIAIHVPLDDYAREGVDVLARVYDLARAVERVTGLEGYDPQLDEPIGELIGGDAGGGGRSDAPVWDDDDDDDVESDGTSTTLPAMRPRRIRETAGSGAGQGRRRWWGFWKP